MNFRVSDHLVSDSEGLELPDPGINSLPAEAQHASAGSNSWTLRGDARPGGFAGCHVGTAGTGIKSSRYPLPVDLDRK